MLQFRDNTTKFVMLLGALLFLFVSSSTQACVLAGHDCAKPAQMNTLVQAGMQCHMPMQNQVHASSPNSHLLQVSSHDNDGECCQLIPADLGDFAKAQVSNISASQFSPDWFHHQLTSAFYSSFYSINFAQREIISPPSQNSSAVSSSPISSLNAGRAPPSAVWA
mgnify:CR=1 FL=1